MIHDDRSELGESDKRFMRLALAQARKAAACGEVPVGAVLVCNEKVWSRGYNQSIRRNDPTAHAEIQALRRAASRMKNYRLSGCDLFVTLEPCLMCTGALVQARIRRLVFGATDAKGGAVVSNAQVLKSRGVHHKVQVVSGVLEEECRRLLLDFFRQLRNRPSQPGIRSQGSGKHGRNQTISAS
jgi:tRNA(adenine34) deaminase